MADYKKMYLELFNSSQKAIEQLVAGQVRAEEIYLASPADPIFISNEVLSNAGSTEKEQR